MSVTTALKDTTGHKDTHTQPGPQWPQGEERGSQSDPCPRQHSLTLGKSLPSEGLDLLD